MSPPMTNEDLRRGLKLHHSPLKGIDETEYEWNFGQVSIHKQLPKYRVGYGYQLGPKSRFYKSPFDFGSTHRGVAAIFHAADPQSSDPDHDEYVVGWVPPERERELDQWIEFLNAEISKRVAGSTPRASAALPHGEPIDIGVFKELGYEDVPDAPSLADVRGKRGAAHKTEVVAYLRAGRPLAFSPGIERDVFDPSKLADSPSVLTDGTYAWPRLLAYYVENYDVALPDEFEAHMRKNGWQIPRSAGGNP